MKRWAWGFVLSVFAVACATVSYAADTIRIGWQPTSTVSSQIANTLARTDILERNGLKGEFIMFTYGPAVNEALVSGAIDVGFIGDLPSVALAAAGAPTTVVARQSTFRGAILATSKSGITSVQDLKGKKLYGPVGSSIHLAAVAMLADAGLKAGTDVEVVNMGFVDLSDAIAAGRVDAVFIWDPWIEFFVSKGLAKVIASDTSLTMVVAARNDFRTKSPDVIRRFLVAQKEALAYAAAHHDQANAWFRDSAAAKSLPADVVATATAYDPQWAVKDVNALRVAMTPAEMDRYLNLGKVAGQLKVFPRVPDLKTTTDMSVAETVDSTKIDAGAAPVTVKP
ncbi:NrtA/SsuA/CpmA family ABC transporter substrate-binding protein [Xanthobacter sp. DSM 24535]|uniref:ABC transporter substrate-binding protein n=1 Tax=Roseixanthobacter psychrophilus TaxID=3119917 RepID=UPI00372AD586